jgi:glycosyltransferase involved in cell wall biosynthesis
MRKRIFCTVTNDLSYDQRMIRICSSLAGAGYDVTLVGRKVPGSIALDKKAFRQRRLRLFFHRGKLFYLEYNFRLFFYLLFRKMDCICAIDLDTILPCYFVSRLRGIPRVYDAHELFCEMPEVAARPRIRAIWKAVEKYAVPAFRHGYTVNGLIAAEFFNMYGVEYGVIRNVPVLKEGAPDNESVMREGIGAKVSGEAGGPRGPWAGWKGERFLLYQGAVNEGRCFETLIPAMQYVDMKLVICGDGNYMEQARALVQQYGLEDKVVFRGYVLPGQLKDITRSAWCGINLVDRKGLNHYYSLANRWFDYMHAGIPQLSANYPAYREINNLYRIAVLLDEPGVREIADALNALLNNTDLYATLLENCKQARLHYNWQEEEKSLLRLYQKIVR